MKDLSFYDVLHKKNNFNSLYNPENNAESFNLNNNSSQNSLLKDMFKDTKTSMQTLGFLGSALSGVGSIMDAYQKGRYQKKMMDFAKQDRELALQNQNKATQAINTAFSEVFTNR